MPALIAVVALALFAWSATRRDAGAERVRDACTALAQDAAAGRVRHAALPVTLEILRAPVADLLGTLDGARPEGIRVDVEAGEDAEDEYVATVRRDGRAAFRLLARLDGDAVALVGFERLDEPAARPAGDGAAGLPAAADGG